jgi:uncharacterized membrane protein YphA (DoxX/SURF4 family)
MVASIFILQGYETFRRPERVAPRAEPVVRQLSDRIPAVPAKTEDAVRLNGAVQMVAGLLLSLGWFPRLAALALAGTLVPTTAAGHRFWEAEEDADRAQQRIHFLKNLSMVGGLLIAAADTGGKPSVAWRARHSAQEARLVARTTRASAKVSARVGAKAGAKAGRASAKAAMIRARAGQAGAKAAKAGTRAGQARAKAAKAGTRAGQARAKAGQLRSRALSR